MTNIKPTGMERGYDTGVLAFGELSACAAWTGDAAVLRRAAELARPGGSASRAQASAHERVAQALGVLRSLPVRRAAPQAPAAPEGRTGSFLTANLVRVRDEQEAARPAAPARSR